MDTGTRIGLSVELGAQRRKSRGSRFAVSLTVELEINNSVSHAASVFGDAGAGLQT